MCFVFLAKDKNLKAIIQYNRGTIKYRMGCFDEALTDLEGAVQKEPDNTDYKEAFQKCKAEVIS